MSKFADRFVIFDQLGHRLHKGMFCKDKKLRDFGVFGTPSWTVKIYRSLPAAKKVANYRNLAVAKIPDGMSLQSSGIVIETVPALGPNGESGYVNYTHHTLNDFVVHPQKPLVQA